MQEPLSVVFLQRLNVALGALLTLAAGSAAGWLTADFVDVRIRDNLLRRAPVAALVLTLDIDPSAQPASPEGLQSPVHHRFRERARRLMVINPTVRVISLLRIPAGEGPAVHLFDFREPSEGQEARPGDPFVSRFGSGALAELRREGRPVLAGPFEANGESRVVAYVFLPQHLEGGGGFRHAVRVEADATQWRESVAWAGLLAGLGTCGIVGIPLAMLLLGHRQRIQSGVIRNLSEAMEQANCAILILDPSGHIEFCNDVGSRLLGVPCHRLVGRGWREFLVAEAAGETAGAEIVGSVAAGVAWQGEWTCLRADGPAFPVRGGFSPVRRRNQRLVAFVVVFDDVTETRRRERELREAIEQAQAGDRSKGHFLATMSHEVRTPLNGIVGFTGLLLETPLSAVQRDYLMTIRSSADSLVRLTADILDFARIESGNARIDPAPGDPCECVEEALELHAAAAAEKGLEIFHRIAPEVPASIITDHGRLRQVLVNLVGNAVKFTERGEVEVAVSVPPGEGGARGIFLEFAVRDTGPGISAEDQKRLFRPFSQLETSSTRRNDGAGLGLAISRNLVEILGGEIRVESRGVGSTFIFSIRAPVDRPSRGQLIRDNRIAVTGPAGAFRESLAAMIRSWGAEVHPSDPGAPLRSAGWSAIVRDLSEAEARRLASDPGTVADGAGTIALLPLSVDGDLKATLRPHFRALLSKPLRSATLLSLLAGSGATQTPAASRAQFGFRVLVAEDNMVNQRLISHMLENFGCRATLVANGREAIAALAAGPGEYDLVLLDMHMPELDGLDVLRAIRAGEVGPAARELWVVAISADVRAEQRAAAAAAGLDEYLVKPINLRAMEEMLLRIEGARRRTPS